MIQKIFVKFGLSAIVLFLAVSSLVEIKPGDPALALAGQSTDPRLLEKLRREHGLDRPFAERVAARAKAWSRGDFGRSAEGKPVLESLLSGARNTFVLGLFAGASLLLLLGVTLGAAAASPVAERWFAPVVNFFIAIPIFVFGLALLFLLYFRWGWLPPGGAGPGLEYLILPGVTLSVKAWARMYFYCRSIIRAETGSVWVRAFRARGYDTGKLLFPWLARRVLPGISGLLFLELGGLLAGSVVVEQLFFYPGFGLILHQALAQDDRVLLTAILFFSGLVYVIGNLAGDQIAGRANAG